jgi:ABC-type branched-subunit amino acid transport system substrate-binding protein
VIVLILAGLVAVTAGCGARWDDDQRAAVKAQARGAVATGGRSGDSASGEDAATIAGATPAGDSAAPGAAPGAEPGATPGQPSAAAKAKPCAAPSTAPGVANGQLTVGSISTLSGAVPGLGRTSLAAVRAYVAYRNSIGGVCGRKIALKTADDAMDNGRYRSALNDMSGQVLGLVGGVGGGDAGGAEVAESKKIPVVNTPISDGFQNVSTVFDINPPYANVNAPIAKYDYLKQQGVTKAAVVYIAVDQTRSEAKGKQIPQIKASGIQVVLDKEVPLSTLSFDSVAREVVNSGADYMFFVSEASQSASMAKSLRDAGAKLKFEEYLTTYGSNFTELAGAAAEGTSNWIRTFPVEEAASNPEAALFVKWMRQVAPSDKPDVFAADAWVSAKAFFEGLDALPGPISREALVSQLRSVRHYDAGGMLGAINLGGKQNKGCFIGMKVSGGKWQRFAPGGKGFLC